MKKLIGILLGLVIGLSGLTLYQRAVDNNKLRWQVYDNELTKITTDYWDLNGQFVEMIQQKAKQGIKKSTLVDIIPQVKPSVVHIATPQWQGSGFIITPHIIATARHVVDGCENFEITLDGSDIVYATRAISSKKHDIAFIRIDEPMSLSLVLGSIQDCQLGQQVFTIGSPFGKRHFNTVTLGIISSLGKDFGAFWGWQIAWQTDAATYPGNSGCPVFTLNGKTVGVLVGGVDDFESISYCVPVDVFSKDLKMLELMFLQDRYEFEEAEDTEYLITQY